MINIAICDDDPASIEKIEGFLDTIHNKILAYDAFSNAIELHNNNIIENKSYDIYFLDIEMEGINGLELALQLRQQNPHSLIIFLTSHPKYVFEVFEVVTFDFLLKPITFEKFQHTLNKALSYLLIAKAKFTFSYRQNSFSIPCDEIYYFEKIGRKAYIHAPKRTYEFNMTLKDIWRQLDNNMFSHIHISYIVNLSYITEINQDKLYLGNGKALIVGRNYIQEIKQKHLQFSRRQL